MLAREQTGHEVRAIDRQLEERLVQKVQVPVLAADVDDKRHRRLDLRDVAEVLFGTDADVDTAARPEQAHHLGEMRLIRHQVVGARELASRLRQPLDEVPELVVAERRRQPVRAIDRRPVTPAAPSEPGKPRRPPGA